MSNHFYVLQSQKDSYFYYGSTDNLNRRLAQHLSGKVLSTKYRRPLLLVYQESFDTIEQARMREHHVKRSATEREKLKVKLRKNIGV